MASINAAGFKRKSGRGLDLGHFKTMLIDPYYAGIIQMSNWAINPQGLHKAMITPWTARTAQEDCKRCSAENSQTIQS